jgi:hypothetical protein
MEKGILMYGLQCGVWDVYVFRTIYRLWVCRSGVEDKE